MCNLNSNFRANNDIVQLKTLINTNKTVQCLINVDIRDYDIEKAHPTALRIKYGEDIFNELIQLDKLPRLIKIGKMQKKDPELSKYFNETLKSWLNEFCAINNIKWKSFIQTTKDSIMIYNKVVSKTKFHDDKVIFRDKDGTFTSLYQIGNRMYLFDNRRNKIIVKGLTDDDKSYFLTNFLPQVLAEIEMIDEEDDRIDRLSNYVNILMPIIELASIHIKHSRRSSLV